MINSYLLVCFVSLVSFFCASILFKQLGIVDKADGIRKIHKGEIPLSGGFSFFLSFLIIIIFIYPGFFREGTIGAQEVRQVFLISPIMLY